LIGKVAKAEKGHRGLILHNSFAINEAGVPMGLVNPSFTERKDIKPGTKKRKNNLVHRQPVEEKELQKVKNKSESLMAFEDMSLMNRANSLAYYELLGDANLMNQEMQQYNSVTTEQVKALSAALFAKENSNTLYYLSDKRI
jgi:predicted Zn-dependent peptidase